MNTDYLKIFFRGRRYATIRNNTELTIYMFVVHVPKTIFNNGILYILIRPFGGIIGFCCHFCDTVNLMAIH